MTLQYKLPKQAPRELPLLPTCTVQAAKDFIQGEHEMTVPFKLRMYVAGNALYLKPDQTLADAAALGGTVLNVNFVETAQRQRKRRLQAQATAALVQTDVQNEGRRTREHTAEEADRLSALLVPHFGHDEHNATPDQLRKRKRAAMEHFDKKIQQGRDMVAALRKLSPADLRARLEQLGVESHGTKAALVRRMVNAAGSGTKRRAIHRHRCERRKAAEAGMRRRTKHRTLHDGELGR